MAAMRVVLAFLVSPAVDAALIVAGMAVDDHVHEVPWNRVSIYTFTTALFIGGYPPALFFGLPTYFILKNVSGPPLLMAMLAGAFVASAPWIILPLVFVGELRSFLDWWRLMQETAIPAFFCGSGAGLVFWFIAR